METFQAPLVELRQRFTTSEIVMLGWRSREQSEKWKKKTKKLKDKDAWDAWEGETPEQEESDKAYESVTEEKIRPKRQRKKWTDGQIPRNLPDKFYNEDGEVNLSQVTGPEAVKYLSTLGIKIPMMGGPPRRG